MQPGLYAPPEPPVTPTWKEWKSDSRPPLPYDSIQQIVDISHSHSPPSNYQIFAPSSPHSRPQRWHSYQRGSSGGILLNDDLGFSAEEPGLLLDLHESLSPLPPHLVARHNRIWIPLSIQGPISISLLALCDSVGLGFGRKPSNKNAMLLKVAIIL